MSGNRKNRKRQRKTRFFTQAIFVMGVISPLEESDSTLLELKIMTCVRSVNHICTNKT